MAQLYFLYLCFDSNYFFIIILESCSKLSHKGINYLHKMRLNKRIYYCRKQAVADYLELTHSGLLCKFTTLVSVSHSGKTNLVMAHAG